MKKIKNPECHTIEISDDKLSSRVTCKVTFKVNTQQ